MDREVHLCDVSMSEGNQMKGAVHPRIGPEDACPEGL